MLGFNFNVRIFEIKRSANFTVVGQTNVRSKVVGHNGFLSASGADR